MSKLEKVFEQAWADLASRQSSLEDILSRYPEHAGDLREMLQTALWLREAPQITVPDRARSAGRRSLAAHMATTPRTGARKPSLIQTLFMRRLAPALAGLALALTVGTAAAQAAQPGDLLYRWRQASEVVRLTVSPDRPETALAVADRRALDLLQAPAGTGQFELAAIAYRTWIDRIVELGLMNDQIEQTLLRHQQMFEEQGIDVPILEGILDGELQEEILPTLELTAPPLPTLDPDLLDPSDLLD